MKILDKLLGRKSEEVQQVKVRFPECPPVVSAFYANLVSVSDADTITFMLDKHFGDFSKWKIRLKGINVVDNNILISEEAERFVVSWLATVLAESTGSPLPPYTIYVTGWDKYGGRWDGYVYDTLTGECLNKRLYDEGLAELYPRKKAE